MAVRKPNLYLISVILFMLVLPLLSAVTESWHSSLPLNVQLAGKWLIFWAIGARLSMAGIRQATKPAFTAHQIFRLNGNESFPVIRELGFANCCMGLIALLSLAFPAWRLPAAVAGGLYFGLAGLLHVIKKPESRHELIALVSDLYIFMVMLLYILQAAKF